MCTHPWVPLETRHLNPLELELKTLVSLHVGAGKQTQPSARTEVLVTIEPSLQPPPPSQSPLSQGLTSISLGWYRICYADQVGLGSVLIFLPLPSGC